MRNDSATPTAPAGPRPRRLACWLEIGAGLAAWLALAALSRPSGPQALATRPTLSVLAVLLVLWLAPGFMLWRLSAGGRPQPPHHAAAYSFGLGMAWLLLPCSAAMVAGLHIDALLDVVVALNAALTAAFALWRRRPSSRGKAEEAADATAMTWPNAWLAGTGAVVLVALLQVAMRRTSRFTYGGDEWIFMKAIRAFLESPTVADPAEFDVWDLLLSLVVRLSGAEVIDFYRIHLPPILIMAALLSFLVLAEAVLIDRSLAAVALVLQGLYALSDMHTRGEGAGMALLVRIAEDKYASLLLALPLAQAMFLTALRSRRAVHMLAFGALMVAAILLQPFALPWLALTCGAVSITGVATGLLPGRRLLALLATSSGIGLAIAWALRALRPGPYFLLHAPQWSFNTTLLELSYRQLWILSLDKGWYMAHPALLSHPLVALSLAASLLLWPRFRRSLEAQWLLVGTWLPVLLVFNPLTAVLAGRLVTPWRLYRILWAMPVALMLAWALGAGLTALERRLASRWPRLGRWRLAAPLTLIALLAAAALLQGRMAESGRAFRARNRMLVTPSEKKFLSEVAALARQSGLGGVVLMPEKLGIRLPVWTTRLQPLPGLDHIRGRSEALLRDCAAFHETQALGGEQVRFLQRHRVDYVILEASSPADGAVRADPHAFRPLHRSADLAFYQWRPQWTATPLP